MLLPEIIKNIEFDDKANDKKKKKKKKNSYYKSKREGNLNLSHAQIIS